MNLLSLLLNILWIVTGGLWMAAFGLFTFIYLPVLVAPRADAPR